MSLPSSLPYTDEHHQFRDTVRRFFEQEIAPHTTRWENQQHVDRSIWNQAGALGFLCPTMPEAYGGFAADKLYSVVLFEEAARVNATGIGWALHSEIVAPYILNYGSETLKQKYLPKMATGELIGAIAMTEPAAGSDLRGIKTTARLQGDHYVLNGSKTFITNGYLCDFVIVVVKTNPEDPSSKSTSLLVVDASLAGFSKGKPLHKIGMKAQDTCELFFDDVKVPAENLLGAEGKGLSYLMQELPWERLQIAIYAIATCEIVLEKTLAYTRERQAFGQAIADFQNTRFKLAEMTTEVSIGRVFVDRCLTLLLENQLDTATASMAKYWSTDLQGKVLDECLQLHGGYGFMWDTFVARAWSDARVTRIYGGTNEIMKEVIARSL